MEVLDLPIYHILRQAITTPCILADCLQSMFLSVTHTSAVVQMVLPALSTLLRDTSGMQMAENSANLQSIFRCFVALTRQPLERSTGNEVMQAMLIKGPANNMARQYTTYLFDGSSSAAQSRAVMLEYFRACISLYRRFATTQEEQRSFVNRFLPSILLFLDPDEGVLIHHIAAAPAELEPLLFTLVQDIYSLEAIGPIVQHMVRVHFAELIRMVTLGHLAQTRHHINCLVRLATLKEARETFLLAGVLSFTTQQLWGRSASERINTNQRGELESPTDADGVLPAGFRLSLPKLSMPDEDPLEEEESLPIIQPAPPSGKSNVPISVSRFRIDTTAITNKLDVSSPKNSYFRTDDHLHQRSLALILALLVSHDHCGLESCYTGQYPETSSCLRSNVLHYLHEHVNALPSACILTLYRRVQIELGPGPARLLRLLSTSLFDATVYRELEHVARGGFGIVYRCVSPIPTHDKDYIAVKIVDRPTRPDRRCALFDIFAEVSILENLRGSICTAELFSYGVTQDSYFVVMEYAAQNLTEWRLETPAIHVEAVLAKFYDLCLCVDQLHRANVVHCDLKCDNVLVRGNSQGLAVFVVDFGESIFGATVCPRARGTEGIKSPEMLFMGNGTSEASAKDTRMSMEESRRCDIWSLGCLLFELCAGRPLFQTGA